MDIALLLEDVHVSVLLVQASQALLVLCGFPAPGLQDLPQHKVFLLLDVSRGVLLVEPSQPVPYRLLAAGKHRLYPVKEGIPALGEPVAPEVLVQLDLGEVLVAFPAVVIVVASGIVRSPCQSVRHGRSALALDQPRKDVVVAFLAVMVEIVKGFLLLLVSDDRRDDVIIFHSLEEIMARVLPVLQHASDILHLEIPLALQRIEG